MVSTPPTIVQTLAELSTGKTTSTDLTTVALARAEALADLNIFATLNVDGALAAAESADRRRRTGEARSLEGVPITIKDLFNVRGMRARGGSKAPMPDLGTIEGTAVSRLREAGAVILGTTNMHEVGLGLTGENPSTGDVKNPFDPARQVGGSSSGAGAATGADIGLAALGSDTGGSIRVPASHCGASSFKPTLGIVPLDGTLPLAPTCDHAGPIANSVEDARRVVEVMSARTFDVRESAPAPRLGVPWRFLEGRLSGGVRSAFEALMQRVATEQGLSLLPPVDDEQVLHGQATVGLEILNRCVPVAIFVPVGGGGLLAATAAAVKQINPQIKVIGVEPEGEDDTARSFRSGARVVLDRSSTTIADAVRLLTPGKLTLPLIEHYVDDIVTVCEAEIAEATVEAASLAHLVLEPSGALSIAAAKTYPGLPAGGIVVAIGTGGNTTIEALAGLQSGLATRGQSTDFRNGDAS